MELINGSYKALEKEFLDYFGKIKKEPLEKVLIITQSARLSQRLKEKLLSSRECVACVFWQDILGLVSNINQASDNYIPLKQKRALDYFKLKDFLQRYNLNTSAGYIKALQASFMDMQNALIMPQDLLKIKEYDETLYTKELKELIFIYQNYLKLTAQTGKSSYKDFFTSALENIENNKYLSQFKQIIFYGIYDWTNLQYDILKAISRAYPTALFFPYEEIPSYKYIQDFYLTNILGLGGEHKNVSKPLTELEKFSTYLFENSKEEKFKADLKIIDAAGTLGQVQSAAKEVLILHKQGFDFKDIAVCARSLESYKNDLIRVFKQNDIPLNINSEENFSSQPLISFCLNLLNVVKNNFHRDSVLSFITSPYLKADCTDWEQVIKNIGVQTGFNQWMNLLDIAKEKGIVSATSLKNFLEQLEQKVSLLNEAASFSFLVSRTKEIFNDFLNFDILNAEEQNLFTLLENILEELSSFDEVRFCNKGEFLEELTYLTEQKKINVVVNLQNSLTIADIMNLRGQSFKVIILLGLNESAFPAKVSEDPVFKDFWRSILQRLGYNIKLSVQRYQEEKLFFYLALSSASDKAILIYQRCDDKGKEQVSSIYLNWILKYCEDIKTFYLSKSPEQQMLTWYQISPDLLTRQEAAVLSSLKGDYILAANLIESEEEDLFLQAFSLSLPSALGEHDLICQSQGPLWQYIIKKGLSPSSISNLYKCPARYLFSAILNRKDIDILQPDKFDDRDKGNLYHDILNQFYSYLKERNLLDKISPVGSGEILQNFIKDNIKETDYKQYGLYPLLWAVNCQEMEEKLKEIVALDLAYIEKEKQIPSYFEKNISAEIGHLKIHGQIDRIDISSDGKSFNITDYKSGDFSVPREKKEIVFKNVNFQVPFYFELAKNIPELSSLEPLKMIFLAFKDKKQKGISYSDYLAFKKEVWTLAEFLQDLVKEGFFIITPGSHSCKYCQFEDICRKKHSASQRRAYLSAQATKLRGYHVK